MMHAEYHPAGFEFCVNLKLDKFALICLDMCDIRCSVLNLYGDQFYEGMLV